MWCKNGGGRMVVFPVNDGGTGGLAHKTWFNGGQIQMFDHGGKYFRTNELWCRIISEGAGGVGLTVRIMEMVVQNELCIQ